MTSKMMKFFEDFAQSRVKGEEDAKPSSVTWQFLGGNNKNRIGANCGLASFFDADAKDGAERAHAPIARLDVSTFVTAPETAAQESSSSLGCARPVRVSA